MKNFVNILAFMVVLMLIVGGKTTRNEIPVDNSYMISKIEASKVDDLDGYVDVETYVVDDLLSDDQEYGDEIVIIADPEDSGHFEVVEFLEYDPNPTGETVEKIKEIHIPELEKVRSAVGKPIIIRSASRTKEHELKQGRSGKSVHIFPRGTGAVDVSLKNYASEELNKLEQAIFKHTQYMRVARYNTFLHVDFARTTSGNRSYYRNTRIGWMRVGDIK